MHHAAHYRLQLYSEVVDHLLIRYPLHEGFAENDLFI